MKKDATEAKWKEVLDSHKVAPICSKWSATDEKISNTYITTITLAGTALDRHQQIIKKQVTNVITKMIQEE